MKGAGSKGVNMKGAPGMDPLDRGSGMGIFDTERATRIFSIVLEDGGLEL